MTRALNEKPPPLDCGATVITESPDEASHQAIRAVLSASAR